MRIKLSFISPLPPLKCWYHFSRDNYKSVHRLSEEIAREFNIDHPLLLEMDGFPLMPRSDLTGLVKEKDLITVKAIVDNGDEITQPYRRKRKVSIIQNESNSEDEKKRKKIRSSKKSINAMDTKTRKEEKGRRKLEHKLIKAAKKKREEKVVSAKSTTESQPQTSVKSDKKSVQPKSLIEETEPVPSDDQMQRKKSIPGEGSLKTRSRNQRRRRLKKAMAGQSQNTKENEPMIQQPQPTAANQEPEIVKSHVLKPAEQNGLVPSSSLLKKNRNKRRGFLNDIQDQEKEHIRFETLHAKPAETIGGTAIITSVELDSSPNDGGRYNLRSKTEKKYPVQLGPRVVKANQISVDSGVEDLEGNTWVGDAVDDAVDDVVDYASHDNADNTSNEPQVYAAEESADMDEVIDYNSCEVVNFTSNLPQELDVLAIKTLVLSATYTPEISDWRGMYDVQMLPHYEVVVKEIDIIDGTITVEHLGLTDKALREGGRFELGANDETESENYNDDDSIVTLLKSDIVDMRRIR